MARKRAGAPGYRKPPSETQFKAGMSGNPAGRPKGSRNVKTIIEKELSDKITVTANGRSQRLSKGEIAVRQLVNQAAAGDPKALQTVWNHYRAAETRTAKGGHPLEAFDTPEHHLVMDTICRRIRAMEDVPPEPEALPDLSPDERKG